MDIFARGSGIADIEEAIPFRFICNEFWKSRSQSIQRCIWILQRTLEIGSPYQFLPHPPFYAMQLIVGISSLTNFNPKEINEKQFFVWKVPQTTNLFDEFERSWPWSQKKKLWMTFGSHFCTYGSTQLHVNHYHIRPSWFATTFASLKHSTERRCQLWK